MEREKAEIMEGIADILRDAKNNGFDTAILKHVLKLKKMDRNKLAELDTLIEVYREAAGV